jgi:hypothetical protein
MVRQNGKLKVTKVKYVCANCKHVELYTPFEIVIHSFLSLFMTAGAIFCVVIILLGPGFVVKSIVDTQFLMYVNNNHKEFRQIAINMTEYDGGDPFMFALDVAYNLPRVRYVPSSAYDLVHTPNEILEYGGDCKNSAMLYAGLLRSLGIEAEIYTSVAENHAVTKIPNPREGKYMIVDLTADTFFIYPAGADFWEDYNNMDVTNYSFKYLSVGSFNRVVVDKQELMFNLTGEYGTWI